VKKNIFVVQSYAVVNSFCASRLPSEGETLMSSDFFEVGGGKGLGQALASRFFDVAVEVIGHVGNDEWGLLNQRICDEHGIGRRFLVLDNDLPTGKCAVFRSENGENAIMIYPGAANNFSLVDFERAEDYIKTCVVGGFQFEVNPTTVCMAIKCADNWGVRTFLDPAPVPDVFEEDVYRSLSFIKPNEHEARLLTGIPVVDYESGCAAGTWFLEHGVKEAAIITMGGQGAVYVSRDGTRTYPAPKVNVADASAAGDCFAGAFLAAIAEGRSHHEALVQALCMGALKATNRVAHIYELYDECYKRQYTKIYNEYMSTLHA
jgi:ribokinase